MSLTATTTSSLVIDGSELSLASAGF